MLVVEGMLDEDDVAEAFDEKDEGDEASELDGGMLDDVVCSTEIDVGVGVVNGGELDGLEADLGVVVGVAGVVVSGRQKLVDGFCVSWMPAHQFTHQLQRHWEVEVKHPALGDASCVADAAGDAPS